MFQIKKIAFSLFHRKFLLPRLIFQAYRPFSLIALLNLQEKLETTKIPCSSCGFDLQINDSFKSGYIDSKILLKHQETVKPEENDTNENKKIYCERCHAIKSNKNEIPAVFEEKKLQEYSLSEFINEIYSEIKPYSLVIYLIDLANFQATIIPEIFRMKSLKTCKIWLIINKIDVLPVDFELPKAKSYIRRHFKGLELPIDEILFLSSKTGVGFDRMLSKLNPLQDKGQYRTVYILGCTNTGKSTFINTLLRKLKPHSSENKHPKLEEEIPTSQLPNTTLKTMIREVSGLKYKFFDTPGIPNEVVLGREMSGLLRRNRNLVIAKRIKPERVDLSNGSTMFIGGLARIDYPVTSDGEATRVIFHLYCAYDVALHRTSMEKANEIYLKHYNWLLKPVFDEDITKTTFKKHEITINFARNGESLEFLEIFGLGWLRFSKLTTNSQKTAKINLFLPETVHFGMRESMRSSEDPHNPQARFRDLKRRKKEKNQRISRKILNNNP